MDFSLGFVEVSSLGNAIIVLDEMLKVADVEFVATERKLGGRLVTVVVRGSISAVTASVETGRSAADRLGCLKSAEVIARPHPEILKFIHLDEENEPAVTAESAATHTGSIPKKKASPAAAKKTEKTVSKAEKASDIKKAPKKSGKQKS